MALTADTDIDLPLDIWTEILSYLTIRGLFKTCRLNRVFLDLSLDFLYQEVYLDSTDPEICQTFNTFICDQLVANRVRRIFIFSRVTVPAAEPRRDPLTIHERLNETLIRLEELRRLFNRKRTSASYTSQEVAMSLPPGSVPKTLDLLLPSIRDLTVVFADRNQHVVGFLQILWEKHRIGGSLKSLKVVGNTLDVLLLLVPIIRYRDRTGSDESSDNKNAASCDLQSPRNPRLCSITHLSVHFIPELDPMWISPNVISKYFSQLFKPLAPTLSSFSLFYASCPSVDLRKVESFDLKNPHQQDLSQIWEALPYLPALKEVRFQAPFTSKTMTKRWALTEWLRTYQGQLEHLTIRATTLINSALENSDDSDSSTSSEFASEDHGPHPGDIYAHWLTSVHEPHHRGFLSLTFAMLRSLEIRTGYSMRRSLPPLKITIPSLRSLTLGRDDWLLPTEIEEVMQGIFPALQDEYYGLETLRFRCTKLLPALLDLLHEKLPYLKVLEVDTKVSSWFDGLLDKKYSWKLSYLRITTSSQVPKFYAIRHSHPDLKAMRALADCLEVDPVLDVDFTCGCV